MATGVGGVAGNKGAVAARLQLHQSEVVFVNAHLAAHQAETAARNAHYCQIRDRLLFSAGVGGGGGAAVHELAEQGGELPYAAEAVGAALGGRELWRASAAAAAEAAVGGGVAAGGLYFRARELLQHELVFFLGRPPPPPCRCSLSLSLSLSL
eukprot:SAG11_NODE_6082_length_1391_cov_2.220588_3_plen_152_part_01